VQETTNLLILHISNHQGHFSPLYPGTHFPACPGGGVLELPNPMHDAVIGDPVSGERNTMCQLAFQCWIKKFLQYMNTVSHPRLLHDLITLGIHAKCKCII
jgi:hypothetical protein